MRSSVGVATSSVTLNMYTFIVNLQKCVCKPSNDIVIDTTNKPAIKSTLYNSVELNDLSDKLDAKEPFTIYMDITDHDTATNIMRERGCFVCSYTKCVSMEYLLEDITGYKYVCTPYPYFYE